MQRRPRSQRGAWGRRYLSEITTTTTFQVHFIFDNNLNAVTCSYPNPVTINKYLLLGALFDNGTNSSL